MLRRSATQYHTIHLSFENGDFRTQFPMPLAECSYIRLVLWITISYIFFTVRRKNDVMVRWKCNLDVGKHLINHLQKQSLSQGRAMSSHISTQPDPSNITGHAVLIFHSSQYPLAVNRIYTRLSMLKGGLPSHYSTARIYSSSKRAHSKLLD